MNYYELTCLILPELSTEELTKLSSEIVNFIKENNGLVRKITEPIRRKLGYPIKKRSSENISSDNNMVKKEAFLTTFNFCFNEAKKIKSLEKKLKQENRILRFMILTKKEPVKEKISLPKKIIKPAFAPDLTKAKPDLTKAEKKEKAKIKKVELKEIDEKIEEILHE